MSDQNLPYSDKEQSGMKAIIILLVICPMFIVVMGFIFVAQVNQMRRTAPVAAPQQAGGGGAEASPVATLPPPSKYSSCIACHGDQGQGVKNETVKGPRLAGLSGWYIKKQIQKFRDGSRGAHPDDKMGAQMVPFAKMLATDADIDEVIGEIEQFQATAADTGHGDVARGQASLMICKTCHGQQMEGNEQLGGPPLRQQHAWYLYDAMKNFKAGIRGSTDDTPEAQQMRAMTMMFATDDAIHDVIAAIQALNE